MRKSTLTAFLSFIIVCSLFGWAQNKIMKARADYREEEKILMLSDRPEVTKIAAMGFDGLIADLYWIRAIQYFGGNFSTLNRQEKRTGMINLLENLVGLDPHFLAAYKFGGFVINESIHDNELAIDFLLKGADNNPMQEYPEAWRLPFDAGFIAFYQLKDYDVAKDLFLQAVYGKKFTNIEISEASGVPEGESTGWIIDGDPYSQTQFQLENGSFVLDLGSTREIGRITVIHNTTQQERYRLSSTTNESPSSFEVIESATNSGTYFHDFSPAIEARYLKFDQFETRTDESQFSIAEIRIFGPRNEAAPPYVERMAYEMDRAAGRFKASFDQYLRYYQEAVKKGDQVSADLALDKLFDIYTNKCIEILQEATELYLEEKGELPSARMFELVKEGYLQRVLAQRQTEESGFAEEVAPVLMPNGNIWELLTTWDRQEPHLLIKYTNEEGEQDWYITSRVRLKLEQKGILDQLQQGINKYKEEKGELPAKLEDLTKESWFGMEEIPDDPLGGEFYLNQETGKVEAKNPKY